MTTPTSSTQNSAAARFAKAPSLLHNHLAEFATKSTGIEVDPKVVQIVLGLHGEFQKSEAWKAVKAADAKERANAAKTKLRNKRTDKVKAVVEPDDSPKRPDDSHLQYKVWSDEMVEDESGNMVWAMLPVEPLPKGEGHTYTVVERVNDASDLQVHKPGCADIAQYRKQKGFYHIRNVQAHDPIHVAYIEISEINQSNGEGTMGYDIDSVNILPCAHEVAKKATTSRKRPTARKRPAAVSMDVTDAAVAAHKEGVTPEQAEAIVLETGGTKEEAEAAAIEQEYLDERAANRQAEGRTRKPRVRRATKPRTTSK